MRAFIALEVPEEIKDNVERVRTGMGSGGLVFVKRDAMHVTLQFLGDVSDTEANGVIDAMRGVSCAPFTVRLQGVSYFTPDFIRVIFVKVGEGAKELEDLYRKLGLALSGKGMRFEQENYVPHMTIARVKRMGDRARLMDFMKGHAETDFGSFKASSVVLKKSVLAGGGPVYTDLYELKF